MPEAVPEMAEYDPAWFSRQAEPVNFGLPGKSQFSTIKRLLR